MKESWCDINRPRTKCYCCCRCCYCFFVISLSFSFLLSQCSYSVRRFKLGRICSFFSFKFFFIQFDFSCFFIRFLWRPINYTREKLTYIIHQFAIHEFFFPQKICICHGKCKFLSNACRFIVVVDTHNKFLLNVIKWYSLHILNKAKNKFTIKSMILIFAIFSLVNYDFFFFFEFSVYTNTQLTRVRNKKKVF